MHTEKLEYVGEGFVIFPTLTGHGPAPYGSFLYNTAGQRVARVIAEPEALSGAAGVGRHRYKVEFSAELAPNEFICFE